MTVMPNVSGSDQDKSLAFRFALIQGGYTRNWTCSSVPEQVKILSRFYPKIDFSRADQMASEIDLTNDLDGIMVFPKHTAPGRICSTGHDYKLDFPYDSDYKQLSNNTFCNLRIARAGFLRNSMSFMDNFTFRINAEAKDRLKSLEKADDLDFMVRGFNLGIRKNNLSPKNEKISFGPRRSREMALKARNELPLGVIHMSTILMTNPGLLLDYKDFWFDCSGDEVNWYKNDSTSDRYYAYDDQPWASVPCFTYDGYLRILTRKDTYASGYYGTPVLFI